MPVIFYHIPPKVEAKPVVKGDPIKIEQKRLLAERARLFQATHWGQMFKQIREEQQLSQRELATIAQVNRNALRKMEQDPKGSSFDIIEKIAATLGYSFDIHLEQKSPYAVA